MSVCFAKSAIMALSQSTKTPCASSLHCDVFYRTVSGIVKMNMEIDVTMAIKKLSQIVGTAIAMAVCSRSHVEVLQ